MTDLEQIAIHPDHFAVWSSLIASQGWADHGLTRDEAASATPRADGCDIYTFPREHTDAVLRDYVASLEQVQS